VASFMPVPEASVHKKRKLSTWEYYVRTTWQVSPVETKSVTELVSSLAHRDFRLRFLARNTAHYLRTSGG